MSQREVAEAVNARSGGRWMQSTVAKIEYADRPIRLNEVDALADVFGVTVSELVADLANDGAVHRVRDVAVLEVGRMMAHLRDRTTELLGDAGRVLPEPLAPERQGDSVLVPMSDGTADSVTVDHRDPPLSAAESDDYSAQPSNAARS